MNKKVIIFGAGIWGRMAYYYYKDKCEIECFVDNSNDLWGKKIEGVSVRAPRIIGQIDLRDVRIVIANKWQSRQIFEQLYEQFGISECIIFSMETVVEEYAAPDKEDDTNDECIINYKGGLGNQMFQYALARCFMAKGRYVTGDVSSYYQIEAPEFILEDVFPAVSIKKCNVTLRKRYKRNDSFCIIEPNSWTIDKMEADFSIFELEKGYFEGYWQSAKYIGLVEKELRKDFKFADRMEEKLCRLSEKIIGSGNAVSIHIRRGDYLTGINKRCYGNICTDEYYKKAIKYINDNVKDPVFYFFSNDIEWARNKYGYLKAVYISEKVFDYYEDWYDMFLMSCCKHNIIANSTFSWWGAWLNQNKEKIVMAPKRWVNSCDYKDIYPKEWVQI